MCIIPSVIPDPVSYFRRVLSSALKAAFVSNFAALSTDLGEGLFSGALANFSHGNTILRFFNEYFLLNLVLSFLNWFL